MKPHPLPLIAAAATVLLSTAQAGEPAPAQHVQTPVIAGKNITSLPSLVGPLPDQSLSATSSSIVVGDLDNYFTGKGLTYSVSIAGDSVAMFSFDASNVLSLTPIGSAGTAVMTITATDKSRGSIQTSFTVTVAGTPDAGYRLTQIE